MIDSHCHLDHEPLLENLNDVINRSKEVGLTKILTICTSLDSFERIKSIIKKDEMIYGTYGIHPHETENDQIEKQTIIKEVRENNKDRLNTIVYTSLEMIRKISFMLYPIIPDSIEKALTIFNLKITDINFNSIATHNYLETGNDLKKIGILFMKIEKKND